MAAFVLLGFSMIISWGLATFLKPTHSNWKALSIVALMTAGLQVPAFLFHTIVPCQSEDTNCTAGKGFFMLLYSVIFLTSLTAVTQCFNYPLWRNGIEEWKVKDRHLPLYEYEDNFEDDRDYIPRPVNDQVVVRVKRSPQNRVEVDKLTEDDTKQVNTTSFPTQEPTLQRRKKKAKEETHFYYLGDGDDASQCLSGMSAELPTDDEVEDEMIPEFFVDEESPHMIVVEAFEEETDRNPSDKDVPTGHKSYNEDWGAKHRSKEQADTELKSPPRLSPGRAKVLKRGNETVSYLVLNDDDDDYTSQCLNYGNDAESQANQSFERGSASHNGSYDDYEMPDDVSDIQSSIYEDCGRTGAGELIVVSNSERNTESSLKNSNTDPLHAVSDDENDDDVSFETANGQSDMGSRTKGILEDFESGSADHNDQATGAIKRPKIPRDEHLTSLLAKLTDLESYRRINDDKDRNSEEDEVAWHDVLDGCDVNSHLIKYQDTDDIDDEKDHFLMMKALRKDTTQHYDVSSNTQRQTEPDDEIVSHVIVSDDEGSPRPRRHLYPDEVEV